MVLRRAPTARAGASLGWAMAGWPEKRPKYPGGWLRRRFFGVVFQLVGTLGVPFARRGPQWTPIAHSPKTTPAPDHGSPPLFRISHKVKKKGFRSI